jgi:hypothetical protein
VANKQGKKTVLENTKQGKYETRQKYQKFYYSTEWQRTRLFILDSCAGLSVECLKKGLTVPVIFSKRVFEGNVN